MSSYKLTTPAANDYVDILAYTLDKWGLEQYEKYQKLLASTFQKVADMPALGKTYAGTPRTVYGYHTGSHVVFYRRAASHVEILRILHQGMDFPRHLK